MGRFTGVILLVACQPDPSPVLRRAALPAQSATGFTGLSQQAHELRMRDGFSSIELSLPDNTLSFLVEVEGELDAEYLIDRLEGPPGALVVEAPETEAGQESGLGAAAGPFFSPNRSVAARGGTTLLVPNDPFLEVFGGTYQLGLRSSLGRDHSVQMRLWVQTGSAYPLRCRLPVHIHRPPPLADDAGVERRVLAAFEEMEAIYRAAGIDVSLAGLHRQEQLPTELPSPSVDLQSYHAAFARGQSGLNIFVVDALGDEDPALGGYASAIPLSARATSRFSGVVVALGFSDPAREEDLLAYTMAHESAHGLGLFHVQEFAGWEDPLADTTPGEGENLMGVLARHQDRNLSPSQALVMRSHPLCRSSGLDD
ncbi:MAG: hypothetical protein CMH55_07305 [Myxococcales bacterium]|nr:hypothetical protein [Myxococcales bacterium]